jgi:uncharacterized membrane protein YqjE
MSPGLLESAQNLLAGLLDLGRTRFELFSTELREELTRLAATILGGLAVLVFGAIGLGFGAVAIILSVSEQNRLAVVIGAAVLFLLAAAGVGVWLYRITVLKPRPFDATIAELRRDLTAIKP